MSQEKNVELVRQQIGAWNSRAEDWPEFYDSEAAFHMPKEWPEDAVYSGHDGIRRVDALVVLPTDVVNATDGWPVADP
jgi:hypothetical protein